MPNALEYEIEYASRPAEDTVVLELEFAPGVTFHYQPPLEQWEIDGGAFRPDNVVGSYAVYYERSGRIVGGDGAEVVNYETGKLCHIYRPFLRDAAGNQVWCDQTFERTSETTGTLTITMPLSFWDAAVGLVILGPTFGYSSVGGSNQTAQENELLAFGPHAPASAGDAASISVYNYGNNTGHYYTAGIYSDNSGTPNALLRDSGEGTGRWSNWATFNLDSALAVASGTPYWLALHSKVYLTTRYDSADGFSRQLRGVAYSAGTLPNPFGSVDSTSSSRKHSIYATYTEAAAGKPTHFMHYARQRAA